MNATEKKFEVRFSVVAGVRNQKNYARESHFVNFLLQTFARNLMQKLRKFRKILDSTEPPE